MILPEIIFGAFITLTGPDNQAIQLNIEMVATLRSVRAADHFSKDIRCLIFTSDAKYIGVVEPCEKVIKLMEQAR